MGKIEKRLDTETFYKEFSEFEFQNLSEQEIFDNAVVGLYKQQEFSVKDGSCVYRHPNNKKCAIGFSISDKEYDPRMEYEPADILFGKKKGEQYTAKQSFAEELQDVHDSEACRNFDFDWAVLKDKFRQVAQKYNLSTKTLDTLE